VCQRQFGNAARIDHLAAGSVRGLEQGGALVHRDALGVAAKLECDVDLDTVAHADGDVIAQETLETRGFHFDAVHTRRQKWSAVGSGFVRGQSCDLTGIVIG
jgi:hypothetical protein